MLKQLEAPKTGDTMVKLITTLGDITLRLSLTRRRKP